MTSYFGESILYLSFDATSAYAKNGTDPDFIVERGISTFRTRFDGAYPTHIIMPQKLFDLILEKAPANVELSDGVVSYAKADVTIIPLTKEWQGNEIKNNQSILYVGASLDTIDKQKTVAGSNTKNWKGDEEE